MLKSGATEVRSPKTARHPSNQPMPPVRINVSENASQLPADAIRSLQSAERLAILTGAGISAESGLPTFRDKLTGFWSRFSPAELANPDAFERDPELVWGWYQWRRRQMAEAHPNAAHVAISEFQRTSKEVTLITQNVDDLHERAGSVDVIHLHGRLNESRCSRCGRHAADEGASRTLSAAQPEPVSPPRCRHCGHFVRPDVTWFGEELPSAEFGRAMHAAQSCDVFLCIGTSSLVFPAADLPLASRQAGAVLNVINTGSTPVDRHADFVFRGSAAHVLPLLLKIDKNS